MTASDASELPTARTAELVAGRHWMRALGAPAIAPACPSTGKPRNDCRRCRCLERPDDEQNDSSNTPRLVGRSKSAVGAEVANLPRSLNRTRRTRTFSADTRIDPHGERKPEQSDRHEHHAVTTQPSLNPTRDVWTPLVHRGSRNSRASQT